VKEKLYSYWCCWWKNSRKWNV